MYDNNLILPLYSYKHYIIENYLLYDSKFKQKNNFVLLLRKNKFDQMNCINNIISLCQKHTLKNQFDFRDLCCVN